MSDSHENIDGAEALEKIKEMVSHARTCQMLTVFDKRPVGCRPMGGQKMDDAGKMLFL